MDRLLHRPGALSSVRRGYPLAIGDVHVVPQGEAWSLEVAGVKQESFDTQDEAIRRARELAEQEHGELVIHGEGGQVRGKDSPGNYPRDIPG